MNAIEPVTRVLSQTTVYRTPAVFSYHQGILTSEINFPTFNEEYVVQRVIQEYQAKKAQEQTLWRIGGAIAGLCLGLGNGFQLGDLAGSLMGATASGLIANELQKEDEAKLRELNLEWINKPNSYIYHRKRHRGDAVRRLLLILPHSTMGIPSTVFAVQFPDGYIAQLAIIQSLDTALFSMAGFGFDTDWVQEKRTLGYIQTDRGSSLPVELWRNSNQMSLVAIPYRAPHHSMY